MDGRIKRSEEKKGSKLPVLGKIKVGRKGENGYPQSVDYFICDSKYKSFFDEAYGEKPDTIQIAFISDSFESSCDERFECRDKDGRLSAKGDGESYYLYDSIKKKYLLEADKEKLKNIGKWSTILTLTFVIPKIRGVFGVFQFSTKGKESSVPQIRDAFDMVKESAGTVVNIPFDLTVKKVKSQKPGEKSSFPVVNLVPNVSQQNIETLGKWLSQGNNIKQLGTGVITEAKINDLNIK